MEVKTQNNKGLVFPEGRNRETSFHKKVVDVWWEFCDLLSGFQKEADSRKLDQFEIEDE